MTNIAVNKGDARRLAAARGIKYTAAVRELAGTDPKRRHDLVLQAEGDAARAFTKETWYERVASDFAHGLLRQSPDDVLTPPPGTLPSMVEAEYVLSGWSQADAQFVDDYDGGDELYNVTFTLEVTVAGTLTTWVPVATLQASGITPLAYSPESPTVRLPAKRVSVEVAGLFNRGLDSSWEEQEVLGYDWL